MRVTLLASDLGPTLGGTFAAALATHLPPRFDVTLLALAAGPSTATAHLARTGTDYRVLPVRHAFDLPGLLALRRAVAESQPDVLHAVGARASWLAPFLPRPARLRLTDDTGPWFGLVFGHDRWFAEPAALTVQAAADFAALGVPPVSRVVLAAGGFDRAANLRGAVWAFDVLRYTAPDWHLVLAGDGPLRAETERFARQLAPDDYRVHFVGVRDDLPALMRAVHTVWVTHTTGGRATVAEARTAGVRAIPWAHDPVGLASMTFNPDPNPALTAYFRAHAAMSSAAAVAERMANVYDNRAAASPPAAR